MSFHKDATGDEIHAFISRSYADVAARDADSAFHGVAVNVNKAVRVDSPLNFFVLAGTAPTWVDLNAEMVGAGANPIGSFTFNENTDVTSIANGTYSSIDVTGLVAGADLESFSVSDAAEGQLQYDGIEDFNGTLLAAFYSGSSPSEANYRLAISVNGAAPVFASAIYAPLSLKDVGDGATFILPVTLSTGDTIQVMIAGDGSSDDVAIAHGMLSIK